MIGLGAPIRVCRDHVRVLACPERCLGVELGEYEQLKAAAHPGCAVCRLQPRARKLRVLRKCSHRGCYGRFHPVAIDDTYIDEWIDWLLPIRRLIRTARIRNLRRAA